MLYFSEIVKKKVLTEDNIPVGHLDDLIFIATDNPIVTKIVIRQSTGERTIISKDYIKKINSTITIEKEYLASYLEENELYLVKNLLDKQIIDIKGNKIVRVNDVALKYEDKLSLAGVDVGLLGLLRRLRIGGDKPYRLLRFLNVKMSSSFLSWADIQPLELIRGHVKLKKREEKLEKVRPEDLADYLERTNVMNARKFLKMLDTEKAAEVISNLNMSYQTALFKGFHTEKAAKLISFIDPDEAVDVLLTLSKKKREEILEKVPDKLKKPILHLLSLSNNRIGGLITTEYITVNSEMTVRKVIDKVRSETSDFSILDYVYVVNKSNELVGVTSVHELLLQDLENPVYKFMIQNLVVIHMTTPEEIVVKKMLKYKLYALPVINDKKHIEGIITLDDISQYILRRMR